MVLNWSAENKLRKDVHIYWTVISGRTKQLKTGQTRSMDIGFISFIWVWTKSSFRKEKLCTISIKLANFKQEVGHLNILPAFRKPRRCLFLALLELHSFRYSSISKVYGKTSNTSKKKLVVRRSTCSLGWVITHSNWSPRGVRQATSTKICAATQNRVNRRTN